MDSNKKNWHVTLQRKGSVSVTHKRFDEFTEILEYLFPILAAEGIKFITIEHVIKKEY